MWKKIGFAVLSLFGLAAIVVLFHVIDFKATLQIIRDVGWICILAFTANFSMTLLLPGVGWWILLRAEGVRASYLDVLRANLMGFSLNIILPSMYLGGEPLKLIYLSGKLGQPKSRILATIIINKFQELSGLLLVMIIAAVIAIGRLNFTRRNQITVIAGTLVFGILFGLLLYAFLAKKRLSVRLINALAAAGIARRKLARLRRRAEEMETLIHVAFTKRWKIYLLSQGITMLSAVSLFIRPLFFFAFLKPPLPAGSELLSGIYIVTNLLNTFSFTPGGLGTYEAGLAGTFKLLGIPNGEHLGAAFALVTRIADFTVVALGLWLIVHYGYTQIAKGVAQGEAKVTEREITQAIEEETRTLTAPRNSKLQ